VLIDYNSKSKQLYAKIPESDPDEKDILQKTFSILNIGDTKILLCLLKNRRLRIDILLHSDHYPDS
jgi:hypothetical protein